MIRIVDTALYQWDTGRYITTDIEADHIHFSNKGDSKAVIMELADSKAKIPDYLLQTGKQLCVYVVRNGITVESNVFSVNQRERPESYVYEEDQRNFIYELIARAEDAVENAHLATASANTAANSANIATNSANIATQNANEAAERANEAVTKANNAVKNMMVVVEAKGSVIALNDSSEQSLVGLRVFGKSTQNGTPTPENPVELESVGASGSIDVTVAGNNLFDKENAETVGGYLDPNGKLVGNASIGTTWFVPVSENTKYTISTNSPGGFYFRAIRFLDFEKSLIGFDAKDSNTYGTVFTGGQSANYFTTATFTTPKGCKYVQVGSLNNNFGSDSTIMLNYGDTALPYEPYNGQTLTVSTPNGLPGIPVSSGGNYTDENGQAWICDEIDFARGVYVQRVKQFVVDESTTLNKHAYTTDEYFVCYVNNTGAAAVKNCISNLFINNTNSSMLKTSACIYIQSDTPSPLHFSVPINIATDTTSFKNWAIENDLCVLYPLATPTETALSAEELEAYAALHTNKLVTTVFNDFGAYMSIKYVADTKSYIDNVNTDKNCNVDLPDTYLYYTSLSYAIADLNNGTTANAVDDSAAPVEVFTAENGKKIVRLLADASESTQIDITTDLTLVLNGHTLNLTTAGAYLNFTTGTKCTINGEVEGSAIKKEGLTVPSGSTRAISAEGDNLYCVGGSYILSGSYPSVLGFRFTAGCKNVELDNVNISLVTTLASNTACYCVQSRAEKLIIRDSVLSANGSIVIGVNVIAGEAEIYNSQLRSESHGASDKMGACHGVLVKDNNGSAKIVQSKIEAYAYGDIDAGYGVKSSGLVKCLNSYIFADARSGHVDDANYAVGIFSSGTLTCIDTNVIGPHSAINTKGDVYVKGGTLSGFSHGGLYFTHGAENLAYINNATLKFGVYEGIFEDFSATAYAGFYIGLDSFDSPGISVYMDSCTIEGQGSAPYGEPFVVRSGAVGTTNTLYISNTVNNAVTFRPIRLNGYAGEDYGERAKMKIGMGCNFTTTDTTNPQCAEETGKLYRRMKEDMPMDGRDFNALAEYLNKEE